MATAGSVANLIELPVRERPRERALHEGFHRLRDCELIALVLRTGVGRQDAVALASSLLDQFGGVHGLICQDARTLLRVAGLGEAKVTALLAIRELLKRAELATLRETPLVDTPASACRYIGLHIGHREREVFGLMLLNSRHYVIATEDLFFGTVDRTTVHTREVVKCCLRHNAAAAILFHNHPSGDPEPSQGDIDLTERLEKTLKDVDVRLLDHVVAANMKQVSMAEERLIKSEYHV